METSKGGKRFLAARAFGPVRHAKREEAPERSAWRIYLAGLCKEPGKCVVASLCRTAIGSWCSSCIRYCIHCQVVICMQFLMRASPSQGVWPTWDVTFRTGSGDSQHCFDENDSKIRRLKPLGYLGFRASDAPVEEPFSDRRRASCSCMVRAFSWSPR